MPNPTVAKTRYFKNCLAVFQGGGVKALSFVGAYKEAYERGAYFSEVAGTSAGSIFAAFIAAGATPGQLEEIIRETDFRQFESPPEKEIAKSGSRKAKLLRPIMFGKYKGVATYLGKLGLFSSNAIEIWTDKYLKKLLRITKTRPVEFGDLQLPLHVMATDIKYRKPMVWNSIHNANASVAYAVRCSCTIPVYFQPVDRQYVDGGLLSNLPSFTLMPTDQPNYERILCFSLSAEGSEEQFNLESYTKALIGTVVEGAVDIQLSLQQNLYQIAISDVGLNTVDFGQINGDSISTALAAGEKASRRFFDNEITFIKNTETRGNVIKSEPQALNQIVLSELDNIQEVTILNANCRMIYKLFPTFLEWSRQSKKITFVTQNIVEKTDHDRNHERFRRFLLEKLNVNLIVVPTLPFEGFLFCSINSRENMALVQNSTHAGGHVIGHSTMYAGVADAPAIESLLHRANELVSTSATQQSNSHHSIQVSAAYDDELLGLLKNIKQYQSSSVHLSFQDVKIDQILFLTRYVKSYKYNQIGKIFDLYHETESNFFECLAIDYGSTRMFVAPPVLERHGNYYYLIEGNSRLTYCIKELKLSVIRAVVVENVSHPLPTTGRYPIGKVMISDTNKIGTERYDKFNISEFRWVEEAVRHPSTFI